MLKVTGIITTLCVFILIFTGGCAEESSKKTQEAIVENNTSIVENMPSLENITNTTKNNISNNSENITPKIDEEVEIFDSESDKRITKILISKLKYSPKNYNVTFKKEYDENLIDYGKHSGSAPPIRDDAIVNLKVIKNKVTEYFVDYSRKERGHIEEQYLKYYDAEQNKTCVEKTVSKAKCDINAVTPIKISPIMMGCKLATINDYYCEQDAWKKSIFDSFEFSFLEPRNTSDVVIESLENNYNSTTNEYFCYLLTRISLNGDEFRFNERWAFECIQENNKLTPLLTNNMDLFK